MCVKYVLDSINWLRLPLYLSTGDIWVIFQKLKYVWVEESMQFQGLEFPVDKKLGFYLRSTGYQDEASLEETRRAFGTNK